MSLGRVPRFLVFLGLLLALAAPVSFAKDKEVRIPLPKRTKPTPVQNLNRLGVKALEKHDYEKAKKLFYEAYLIDPNDPFTLNNLGYVAELQGEVDRAQRFYALAAEQPSEARIAESTSTESIGKPVAQVAGKTDDLNVQVNRYNVEAIGLLQKDRAPEADALLRRALALDRHNAFTLNNLGYAQEKQGEIEQALSFYTAAAATGSRDSIVVTPNSDWRGKAISEVASDNATQLRRMMRRGETAQAQVARLNLRGVSAINRNERKKARSFFEQAYKLAPNDAFTLNNMGYLAEMDGDRETAKFYYEKALEAGDAKARVDIATKKEAEGKPVAVVADQSTELVQAQMQSVIEARRRMGGPVVLKRRDNTPVVDAAPAPSSSQPSEPGIPSAGGGGPANAAPANNTALPQQDDYKPATPAPALTAPQAQPAPQGQPSASQPEMQQPQNPQSTVPPPAPPSTGNVPPPTTGNPPR